MKKQRINVYVDSRVWQMFRMYCLQEKVSASAAIEGMMVQSLSDTNIPEQFGGWEGWTKEQSSGEIAHDIAQSEHRSSEERDEEPH